MNDHDADDPWPSDAADDEDRAAILRRRSRFVASAMAGLVLGGANACSDPGPQACLSPPPLVPQPSGAPGTPASEPAPAASQAEAPPPSSAEAPPPGSAEAPPQPCLDVPPQACLKVAPPPEPSSSAAPSSSAPPPLPPSTKPYPAPCLKMARPPTKK